MVPINSWPLVPGRPKTYSTSCAAATSRYACEAIFSCAMKLIAPSRDCPMLGGHTGPPLRLFPDRIDEPGCFQLVYKTPVDKLFGLAALRFRCDIGKKAQSRFHRLWINFGHFLCITAGEKIVGRREKLSVVDATVFSQCANAELFIREQPTRALDICFEKSQHGVTMRVGVFPARYDGGGRNVQP